MFSNFHDDVCIGRMLVGSALKIIENEQKNDYALLKRAKFERNKIDLSLYNSVTETRKPYISFLHNLYHHKFYGAGKDTVDTMLYFLIGSFDCALNAYQIKCIQRYISSCDFGHIIKLSK